MSAFPYLDFAGFRLRTPMPPEEVDQLEARFPGYIAARLAVNSSRLNAQLSKRYATPFGLPVPEIVAGWLVAMTTPDAYRRRGWDAADAQSAQIEEDKKDALAEVQLAADADTGLFDLPLREDNSASAIDRGGAFGYAEASPYDWQDAQREAIRGR